MADCVVQVKISSSSVPLTFKEKQLQRELRVKQLLEEEKAAEEAKQTQHLYDKWNRLSARKADEACRKKKVQDAQARVVEERKAQAEQEKQRMQEREAELKNKSAWCWEQVQANKARSGPHYIAPTAASNRRVVASFDMHMPHQTVHNAGSTTVDRDNLVLATPGLRIAVRKEEAQERRVNLVEQQKKRQEERRQAAREVKRNLSSVVEELKKPDAVKANLPRYARPTSSSKHHKKPATTSPSSSPKSAPLPRGTWGIQPKLSPPKPPIIPTTSKPMHSPSTPCPATGPFPSTTPAGPRRGIAAPQHSTPFGHPALQPTSTPEASVSRMRASFSKPTASSIMRSPAVASVQSKQVEAGSGAHTACLGAVKPGFGRCGGMEQESCADVIALRKAEEKERKLRVADKKAALLEANKKAAEEVKTQRQQWATNMIRKSGCLQESGLLQAAEQPHYIQPNRSATIRTLALFNASVTNLEGLHGPAGNAQDAEEAAARAKLEARKTEEKERRLVVANKRAALLESKRQGAEQIKQLRRVWQDLNQQAVQQATKKCARRTNSSDDGLQFFWLAHTPDDVMSPRMAPSVVAAC